MKELNQNIKTDADVIAEIHANSAAADGKWEQFVGSNPDNAQGLNDIAAEGRADAGKAQDYNRWKQGEETREGYAKLAEHVGDQYLGSFTEEYAARAAAPNPVKNPFQAPTQEQK